LATDPAGYRPPAAPFERAQDGVASHPENLEPGGAGAAVVAKSASALPEIEYQPRKYPGQAANPVLFSLTNQPDIVNFAKLLTKWGGIHFLQSHIREGNKQ
jgi:hypothetical protein